MTTDFQRKAKMNSDTKNMPNQWGVVSQQLLVGGAERPPATHWDCHLLGKREACVSFSSKEPLLQTVG